MLPRHERIERKAKVLKRLDPKRKVELDDTFTHHVANAIRTSSPREFELEIADALEALEDALNGALYEILGKHFATEEDSSLD